MKVCVKCQIELRPLENGIVAIEMASFGPYRLYEADTWQCPGCGWAGILGFASDPFAEHYAPSFTQTLRTARRERVCVEFWANTAAKAAAEV